MNVDALKESLRKNGKTLSDVADAIKVDRTTLYRKLLNDGNGLKMGEADRIKDMLCLSTEEAVRVFFN